LNTVFVLAIKSNPIPTTLAEALRACSARTSYAPSVTNLLDLIGASPADCVVLPAVEGSADDGLEIVGRIRHIDRLCPILLFQRDITAESAVRALRAGASDLLACDAGSEAIAASLRCLGAVRVPSPMAPAPPMAGCDQMVGRCAAMAEVRSQIARVAATDANVIITGETGTGKELVAELIHRNSRRCAKRFVSVNCAAIPDALLESELFGYEQGAFTGAQAPHDGKLQHASGGTLFLDEIGDMTLLSQAKILRAIETRVVQRLGSNVCTPIQVRLVAATNQNLEKLAAEKLFRQDLYFRLNVVRIHLPPLRERQEDIPELAEHMLHNLISQHQTPVRRIEGDVLRRLQMHDWPGNIRELRNVIESMVVFSASQSVTMSDLPRHMRDQIRSTVHASDTERTQILSTLSSVDWNRAEAAHILHCSRMTLYRKMRKYRISGNARMTA
jgi:DNA-binding NtrC family response regulator